MKVTVYETDNGPCPYLDNRRWVTHTFAVPSMPAETYEEMINSGWRRSGTFFYQNHCPGCRACQPIRVPVREFTPSKSQRRVLRRNEDVTIEVVPNVFDSEVFALYSRYQEERHGRDETSGESGFRRFLCDSAVSTVQMHYRLGERLIGVGWLDELTDGLSSVYFVFDPAENRRSLGTHSVLMEIERARKLGVRWHHLGFYVKDSRKMSYKASFYPHDLLIDGRWIRQRKERAGAAEPLDSAIFD
ncbi:MAG: arginyltransferase [Alkalispirochaetaceae bacterium]